MVLSFANYIIPIEEKHYKGYVSVQKYEPPVIEPSYETIRDSHYYSGEEDSAIGWRNVSYSCGVSHNTSYANIYHGAYTCSRDLNMEEALNITPEDNFDISLNVRRVSYGSRYYAALSISGIMTWRYHRDSSDYIRGGYQPDGTYLHYGNAYNTYNNYKMVKEGTNFKYYINDNLVNEIEDFEFAGVTGGFIRAYANNERIRIGNIKIKIYKQTNKLKKSQQVLAFNLAFFSISKIFTIFIG